MLRNELIIFLLAVQFLTRLPMPQNLGFTPQRFAATVRYYPLVGALIGAMAAAVFWLAHLVFPVSVSVIISTAAILLLTGAFHEDGLADTFDGIGGGLTPQRSLKIMKDSRIGTYGACALVCILGLKITILTSMPPNIIAIALVAGHCLSRLSSVYVMATSRYVRDHGTGKPVSGGINLGPLIFSGLCSFGVMAIFAYHAGLVAALWGGAGCLIGHIIMRLFFERKIGGYTGDTLGAVQQSSEIGIYLGVLACL